MEKRTKMYNSNDGTRIGIALLVGLVVLVLIVTLFSSMRFVGTGEVGVVTQYGKVTGRELSEGMSWVAPWGINSVKKYDIKNQKEDVQSGAATKDLQDVSGTLVLNYELSRGEVSNMHKTVGVDYKDKLVIPALNETFKSATAKYNASELITKRAEVKDDVYKQLKDRLEKYGIVVLDVSITDFNFSGEFNKAIEAVQIANQEVAKARQKLEQARIDADRKVAQAKGEAEAQRLQQETLTKELLTKQFIEKWDGKLPTTTAGNQNFLNMFVK